MYHMRDDNLYMIPTAEVPITNLYRDVILKAAEFPVKLAGYSSCFRREAGAWGANVRGLNRAKEQVIHHLSHELKTPLSVLSA